MLSRVADAVYWMGRYLERAEHAARVLEVTRRLLIDLGEVDPAAAEVQWTGTLAALGLKDCAIEEAAFDPNRKGSVASSVVRARENAKQVREVISSELWDSINRAHWQLNEPPAARREELLSEALSEVMRYGFLWEGVADATMGRGEGWYFIRLGHFVERADRTIRLFSARWGALGDGTATGAWRSGENVGWLALLRGCSCLEEYRKRYPTHTDPRDIVSFLVLDRVYPRTIGYSLSICASSTRRLTELTGARGQRTQRAFGKLAARIQYTELEAVLEHGPVTFLEEVREELSTAAMHLQSDYFLH